MKSEDMTPWMLFKHWFGLHTWGEPQYWEVPDMKHDIGADVGIYKVCEVCGKEKIIQTPY